MELREGQKIIITQVRGSKRKTKDINDTLKALGLGRAGRNKEHSFNNCIFGMIRKVEHLVKVEKLDI